MSNIYEKLQKARVTLQQSKLKKSGKNAYAGFEYFELADFLPKVNEIFLEQGLCSDFSIKDCQAVLTIINSEKTDETMAFTMPTAELQLKGCTAIQSLGGVNTYCKRYLYLNALEIVEADMLDAKIGNLQEQKINPDLDILEGLQATSTSDEALRYYRANESLVKAPDAFKQAYMKHYTTLKRKEDKKCQKDNS
jgi:hypothetical protein